MSNFPASATKGIEHGSYVDEFTPGADTNEPFIPGEFVVVDISDDGQVKRCGADPVLIAGISEVDSEFAKTITPNGKVPVRIITGASLVLSLACATTLVEATHVGNSYGITRGSDGFWRLDVGKTTTSSRVRVIGIDTSQNIAYCVMHQNVLQFADITVATA